MNPKYKKYKDMIDEPKKADDLKKEELKTEEWFGMVKYLPAILFCFTTLTFIIFGIVDAVFGVLLFFVEIGGIRFLIWSAVGIFVGFILFFLLKILLAYPVLHIQYLNDILREIKNKNEKE